MEENNFESEQELDLEMEENHRDFIKEDENSLKLMEPKVGMLFESETAAHAFYIVYAKAKGFGVTISNSKKKEGIKFWVQFKCHRGGLPKKVVDPFTTHPTTKIDCKATIKIAKQTDDMWKVTSTNLEHNHAMDPEKSRYLRYYRKLPLHVQREIELSCEVGINMYKTLKTFDRRAGGSEERTWLGKDAENHINKVRRHELKGGDAQAMLKYFQTMQADNKDFFYCIDVDEENCLTKVFWADARSRKAYEEFGDVVTFDTTYLVNKFNMPFAPFVGVNHHGQSTLFGCGLVTREDIDSFVWLFRTWLFCMSNVPPKAIITDQDKAMQSAISSVFPHTRHRWCLWHIMKKVTDKFKSYSENEKIQHAVSAAVYDSLTILDFEESWGKLVEDFKLEKNDWLRTMYDERNRWVPAFVKNTFWAGMSTTQRSESINSFFDGYVHSKTTLKEFAMQYENALRKRVETEAEADAKSMNSQYRSRSPFPFEHQFRDAYTLSKYKQFREQVSELIGCEIEVGPVNDGIEQFLVEHTFEVGTTDTFSKIVKFIVHFNESTKETNCNCRMFESKGMVCAHILRIWKWKKLSSVPESYVLNRWRKNIARSHTNVRLSYTNWQKKPEWRRLDDLRDLFNEAANGVLFSENKTNRLKGVLAQFIQENKEQGPTNVSSATPTSIYQTLKGGVTSVGDPSQGSKRGRPRILRLVPTSEKVAKKAKSKKCSNNANTQNVVKKKTATKKTATEEKEQELHDCQTSLNLVDLNETPIDWISIA